MPTGSQVYVNQPDGYEPGVTFKPPMQLSPVSGQTNATASVGRGLSAATFQSDYGVAQLASVGSRGKATRVFTKADVAPVNSSNGVIKYGGKPARLN